MPSCKADGGMLLNNDSVMERACTSPTGRTPEPLVYIRGSSVMLGIAAERRNGRLPRRVGDILRPSRFLRVFPFLPADTDRFWEPDTSRNDTSL